MSGHAPKAFADTAAKAEATRRQSLAASPQISAWVSANAGSGKTHVLAQRVIRLLLQGTAPGRILCLTYTKAAAANMANRVLSILSRWAALDDAGLDVELARMDNTPPTPVLRIQARRLFAAALETPGGLKIQTIHAFCGGLLHRFPFEAGVAAGFRELDDVGRMELMARIRAELVVEAARAPGTPLGQALTRLMGEMSDSGIDDLLEAAVASRAAIAALGDEPSARVARVAGVLGIAPGLTSDGIEREMLESPHFPLEHWPDVEAVYLTSDKATDKKRGLAFRAALEAKEAAGKLAAYRDVFFKADGDPRSDKDMLTKGLRDAYPELAERLMLERDRLSTLTEQLRAVRALERTDAALTLGAEAGRRYTAEKAARGLLDFDDLIGRTADLLGRVPASFVHYKLDRGIDHVLVDEAQDTSPEQWRVVRGLVSDFFSGEGAREGVKRTLFVVGDEKQSIFSFQGADPRKFGDMRLKFAGEAGETDFKQITLPHSFRSAPGVLDAVDAVFRRESAHAGLTLDNVGPVHEAIRADAPALVELWPTVTPVARPRVDDWRRPLDEIAGDDPVTRLAERIAAFVREGIAKRIAIPSRGGRPMRAQDVLVLVRRRGRLFEAVIRALKEAGGGVDVAGADRLVVAEHIAALDLMALGDALFSPDDDLALASVLKSPLFGLDDDDLLTLCPRREGRLGDALLGFAGGAISERLERWREEARLLRPFDFYARVLGRDGGRKAMLARLGPEAADVLDEFMALARTYENLEAATLPGFLAFLRRGGAETKRDMESGRDEVRVMTVHGAKGLESPIVILADTVDLPKARTAGGLLQVTTADGAIIPVHAPRKADDSGALANARAAATDREREEYRRLLYVALTRAEDALIVCGAETRAAAKDKDHARPEGCWYELVNDALIHEAERVPAQGWEGEVLRWLKSGPPLVPAADDLPAAQSVAPLAPAPLAPLVLPPAPARPVRPSRAQPDAAGKRPGGASEGLDPRVRGDLVHRLLAGLGALPGEQRRSAGLRLLDHVGAGLAAELREDVLAEVMGVLDHAPLETLFGPHSAAEVPVVGRLKAVDGRLLPVNGRLDRLAVFDDRLVLADFKTDRTPPRTLDHIGEGYVAQLALYGAVLEKVFPGRALEARLVYTRGPLVHVLPAERLLAKRAELLAGVA
ncbi:double-strand break repair helicase AddA [Azorhizobium oxalatiphilum]|uniref:DNA 3'-5' helicase n=1 Tax=Azorhizobium oxalatiphilum TaxID=980631 RepID=A0A917BL02_9HYPH|nr:double-strand break repair helicase AddA [Azorhizobium oxalatiphilum]GGF48259.1 double-strand break repair helicase AddA [Azorhizobium oxalatiphilum]